MGAGGKDDLSGNQKFQIIVAFKSTSPDNPPVDFRTKYPENYKAFVAAINDAIKKSGHKGQWLEGRAGGIIEINGPANGPSELDSLYRPLNGVLVGWRSGYSQKSKAYVATGLEAVVVKNVGPINPGQNITSAKQSGPIPDYMDFRADL